MRIEFHPALVERQAYHCNCCGQGCRSFLVPVRPQERQAIEALGDWRGRLQVPDLFVRSEAAGEAGWGLAKRADGSCVFLDGDNLCIIHKLHGLKAKPLACQLYPFVLIPFGGELRVSLRFDCPTVYRSEGEQLTTYRKDLQRLAETLVPAGVKEVELPALCPGQKVSAELLDTVNEVMLRIVDSTALPLALRLQWLRGFTEHIVKVKWDRVSREEALELIGLFRGGVLAELQRSADKQAKEAGSDKLPSGRMNRAIPVRARKLLGQVFFLLTQPTTIVHARREGLAQRLRKRLAALRAMRQAGRTAGPLPKIQPHWPDCDLADLEESFGPWPAEVEALLARYLTCRLAGMNYCGRAFYGYSLVEGARSLLLALATAGWLMRIEALKAGRRRILLEDAYQAVRTIDGNLGYGDALGMGPGRMRLTYLNEHLEAFIEQYCR